MKKSKIVAISCISVLAAITIGVTATAVALKDVLNTWCSIDNVESNPEQEGELMEEGKKLAKEIQLEGTVLAQNKDNLLPLNKDKVSSLNVFGWSSTAWVTGGSGSGQVVGPNVDLIKALNDYGIETNTRLTNAYKDFLDKRPNYDALHTYADDFSMLVEPSINNKSVFPINLLNQTTEFSDTALVVLGRVSGESNDAPKFQNKITKKGGKQADKVDKERTYLDISTEEEELLEYTTENFKNTIVIVNSASQMNLEFLKRYEGIDACLVTGATGNFGATAIPELLYGDANPSGRFSDTYAYDFTFGSSYVNSSTDFKKGISFENTRWGMYSNTKNGTKGKNYPADGTGNGNVSGNAKYAGVAYVDYVEDIYVGYKWYETANEEGYFDKVTNEYGKGYDGVVQFPFGYGLSYTTFEQKVVGLTKNRGSNLTENDEITITVSVKNTGNVAGKDVVQVYLTKPYTKGGIEKSHVELIETKKTRLLNPGEVEEVDIKLKVSDWASYDAYDKNNNSFKGYEIEKGKYQVKVMNNAHEVINKDGVIEYNIQNDIKQTKDPISGKEVKNRFDENAYDGIAIDGSNSDQNITYLSRSNFKETFPSEATAKRPMSDKVREQNLYDATMANAYINEKDVAPKFGENKNLKVMEGTNVTELGYKLGEDFNAPEWEEVLNQVTLDEAKKSTAQGYTHNEAIDSIGKPRTKELDGPAQVGSFGGTSKMCTGNPSATVLAQTFNKDLAYKLGKQIGAEANYAGVDGLYAPGVNIHRSAFGGRNFEYYSEDPYLSGLMGAYYIRGSLNRGTYIYLKHLVCYEQETYRDGLYTWLTEQNLRENYLKPFKMAIQIGGCSGIMTSYNRLGATWASGHHDLIKGVLYDEWDYKGAIITDYSDHHQFMIMDQALRAGTTLWMDGWLNNGTYTFEQNSASFKLALRNAVKRNVYTYLNAKVELRNYNENGDDAFAPVHKGESFAWWVPALGAFDGVMVLIMGGWALGAFLPRKKKENKVNEETK